MTPRVADLTVDELRSLLHQVVEEVIEEKLGMTEDPDEGLELHPDVEQSLQDYLASERRGDDAEDVFRALGLNDS
jgi:hypothetical protein